MADDVTITVRVNNQTANGFRDINGQLRTLDGRFASSAGNMRRSSDGINRALMDVRASLLSLAPAAVPVAASLAPIAVQAGAAGLAVASFGAAVIPQIANLKSAADAQDKYTQAVTKYGAGSKQALQAQQFIADTLKGMPAPTQRAAAAYSNLRDQFKGFSDSTAKFTMVPVEHSFAVLGAILPKLKPMAAGAAGQLDRLVKVTGGAINTSGFDALSKKVSDYANNSLKRAVDGTIHFARALSEGNMHGPIAEFFAYARAQGPAVKELLSNLMQALGNIAQGAAQAGPGLLTIVNAFAKLVAAVPPQLIGNLMQLYAAFKLIKLAGAGISAVAGGVQTLATRLAALQAASAAAGGGLAGLRAAFASLGTAAKASIIVAGIAAAVVVIKKLSDIGKDAPPNVDKLTTSLGNLGRTGKTSGEAARVFGKNLGELYDSVRSLTDPSTVDKVQQGIVKVLSLGQWDSTPVKDAKEKFDAIDKSLENLVRGGKGKLAAEAVKDLAAAYAKGGGSAKDFKSKLDGYKSALADQAFEQKLAAESQGLFGQAAQDAAAKLDAQKASADGLRGAIQALNDVQRQGLGGMIGFEAAIDAAAAGSKKYHDVLSMQNGQLSLSTDKQREAAQLLSDLADKTDAAASSARESGTSWEKVNGIYSRGREQLIASARAMGLNKTEAAALADQILKIPDKTARVKMDDEDARAGLNAFNAAVKRTPGSKSVTLKTLSSSAEAVLESFGFKVKRLPDGSVKVTAKTGGALSGIRNVAGAIASLHDKTVTLTSIHNVITNSKTYRSVHDIVGSANGNIFRGRSYADGGTEDHVAQIAQPTLRMWAEPETGGEAYIPLAQSKRPRSLAILKDVADDFGYRLEKFAKGGKLTKAQRAARAQSQAEAQARHDAMGQLTISRFGHYAGYQRSEFGSALGRPDSVSSLVNALNEWRGIIKKATHGATENRLLKQLDSTGKKLLGYEKAHEKLIKSLEKAKDKLNSLKDASAQLASSVKGNLISSANITKGASGEGAVTLSSVRSGLIASRDKVTAFANALKALKSKGFSKSIIQQVAEAGIDGGGLETAGALLQASSSEVSSINQMQGQIEKAAGSAGKTTADAVYAKAIKDQTAVVKKLTGQQDKLTKAMDKLTKAMEKAIERAFGKKAAGGIVGAAASGGLRSNLTWVGEQGPELLDLPAGSRVWSNADSQRKAQAPWASMLNTPRRAPGAAAAAPPGQPEPIVLELRSSGSETDEFLLKMLRRAIRVRGGNVNVVLTGRP